eukprot:TRINITY_DN1615_c0_g1_i3.p1 TRINITY_DN1615_c0_g1~~TRINITY_DN1615_c0_g1_i3.p1  ORF type:complete len:480 (-),score=30.10 TRINITY_DN1615_c0_g1_i3:46-1485(-)
MESYSQGPLIMQALKQFYQFLRGPPKAKTFLPFFSQKPSLSQIDTHAEHFVVRLDLLLNPSAKSMMNITIDEHKFTKLAEHSHISGFGESKGLVGQQSAQHACQFVRDLASEKKMAGRSLLLVGPSGTGKTALALALSRDLGNKIPFCPVSASEVYSSEVKKTEILKTHFRRSIGVRIKEMKEVFEGEVAEMQPSIVSDSIVSFVVTLKSSKGLKHLRLDPSVYDSFLKERVLVGDVVYIEASSGLVKRVGRSDTYASDHDLDCEDFVPLPKGDVHKRREVIQFLSLHDLDIANSSHNSKKTEITDKLRTEVNSIVNRYVQQGVAEIVPGVLFIDEVHMLDLECFTYLNQALEGSVSPVVVLATNRGFSNIRNSSLHSPHGIPLDLLDRVLIVKTSSLPRKDLKTILRIRSEHESLKLQYLDLLTDLAFNNSLRFASHLLQPISLALESNPELTVTECIRLFSHCSESASYLEDTGFLL